MLNIFNSIYLFILTILHNLQINDKRKITLNNIINNFYHLSFLICNLS